MRLSIIISFLLVSTVVFCQTSRSSYNFIKTSAFFENKTIDYINLVDSVNLNSNDFNVIVGTINSYSNDSLTVLEMIVRKTNVPQYIPENTKIYCLIDFNNGIIYDESSNSYGPFNVPSSDSLLTNDRLVSLYKSDSLSKIEFQWEDNVIEITSDVNVPSYSRATLLDRNNEWGISSFKAYNQLISFIDSSEKTELDILPIIERIKSNCTKKTEGRQMLFL